MKGTKVITILLIINILFMGILYNLIIKLNFSNQKQIIKEMSEIEYENSITSLNESHENFAQYIKESKTKIASAITDMGVSTSNDDSPEMMANNIKNIARDASSINYDNSANSLESTNVQGAIDEILNFTGSLSNIGVQQLYHVDGLSLGNGDTHVTTLTPEILSQYSIIVVFIKTTNLTSYVILNGKDPSASSYGFQNAIYQNNIWYSYLGGASINSNNFLQCNFYWYGYRDTWATFTGVTVYGIK